MNRDANKWCQHVTPPPLSRHLTVSTLPSPHIFGSLAPAISNNPPPPSLFNAYQTFISAAGPSILLSQLLLGYCTPVMTATTGCVIGECWWRTDTTCISMSCPINTLLIASDLHPGGNPLFLPSLFCLPRSPLASQNSNSPLLCM